MDWSDGSYERFAVELEPATEAAVAALGPVAGLKVLDLGCGNGNAALALARAGARTTGADPAERLLVSAGERFEREGLDGEWRAARAEQLPFEDDEFDGLVSVFGVIFADDAARAAAEMRRVVRPGGPIVLTAWRGEGGVAEAVQALRSAVAEHSPPPAGGPVREDWGSPATLARLLGDAVETTPHELFFRADSARVWVDEQSEHHPAWRAVRAAVPGEVFDDLRTEAIAILERHDAGDGAVGFEVLSPYLVARSTA